MKKITLIEFIYRANVKHNFNYDYKNVIFFKLHDKIIIICPHHGEFLQKAYAHLNGQGCPKCLGGIKYTLNEFIDKSNIRHNFKYNYSKVIYHNSITPVEIICPIHGLFKQKPVCHLKNLGCFKCGKKNMAKSMTYTTEKFIDLANIEHNFKYDYGKVSYISGRINVTIICPEHGAFLQQPSLHLRGNGCRRCNQSMGEKIIENFLIDNKIPYKMQYNFKNCRNKKPLPFDFAIFDSNNNISNLIEYQGEDHFYPVKRSRKQTDSELIIKLKNRQMKDKIKKTFCIDNNIHFIEIPYWEKRNIKQLLSEILLKY